MRVDPKIFAIICRKFVDVCREVKQPIRAVKPMKVAISKIAPNNEHLTPQHSLLALACISSKCYKAAEPVLNNFVYLIDPKVSGVRSEDTRLYFYYGGICYIALKQWDKAIEFFETVISAPAVMASAIMVEAYKKYVLASLIHKGQVGNLPRYTNPSVTRIFKQICTPYEELATAFATQSLEDLSKAIENNTEPFVKDNNLGLVGQVRSALLQRSIVRLTDTYVTITLPGLLHNTNIQDQKEAESRILKMIETNGFAAKIHQKDNYVLFQTTNEDFDDDTTVNYLSKHVQNVMSIHQRVALVDRKIESTDRYVQKMIQAEKFPSGRPGESDNAGDSHGPGFSG
jgi:COP9 signalosome complex subunit 3